ncbi:glycosyltransferase family 2 protein [Paenibacillus sp. FSL R10-2771]|uniref:glycosyltransferase family 2 protein n=1 Tax=Paenibacillus sp. FSL R10-2771 TaxID=2954693 RepID=UPI0030F68F7E
MDTQILLSTYNGEKYITAQIESILRQSYQGSKLLIRDDGSKDNTVTLIERYSKKYPEKIHFLSGPNIGVKKSFFELLQQADPNCMYYSFCDQDDIWLEDKLSIAISALNKEKQNQPLLYFAPTHLTNEDLIPQKIWPKHVDVRPSFYNALVDNIVVGTTATINNKSRDLLLAKKPNFLNVIMHDWWSYLCVSALGKVIYGNEPAVLYRQHQGNVIGGDKDWKAVVRRKLSSYSKNKGKKILYNQALEFMDCYGEYLSEEKKNQLKLFITPRPSYISRIKYLRESKLYRQSLYGNILLKYLIFTGYI